MVNDAKKGLSDSSALMGLASFGAAVLASVCELAWQLRGQARDRRVDGARVGITAQPGPLPAWVCCHLEGAM